MIISRRAKLAALLGLALVFGTTLLFMRVFPVQEAVHFTALFFIVLGEALPVACFIWIEDNLWRALHKSVRTGLYTLLCVHGVTAVLMALVLLALGVSARFLAVLEVVLLLASAAILLFVGVMGAGRSERRADTIAAVSFMRRLEDEIRALAEAPANRAYAQRLKEVAEAVRFSDFSGQSIIDGALEEKARELGFVLRADEQGGAIDEAAREKQVGLLTEDLLGLLQSRNRALINQKRERSLRDG